MGISEYSSNTLVAKEDRIESKFLAIENDDSAVLASKQPFEIL